MNEKEIKSLAKRVEKLEKAVFTNKGGRKTLPPQPAGEYSGATGGMRLLTDEGFFTSKRGLGEVKAELSKRGYHYSIHAVQMGLNRLSKTSGPLVAFKESGKKAYAQRK